MVRSEDTPEQDFIKRVKWDGINYLHLEYSMNPVKVRVTRKMAEAAGIKPMLLSPRVRAVGHVSMWSAGTAADGEGAAAEQLQVRLRPRKEKRQGGTQGGARQEQTPTHGGHGSALRQRKARTSARSTVRASAISTCSTRLMFHTFEHPADTSCRFTHGDRGQTGKVACYFAAECTDMGCPYMHPTERHRQAKAVDMAGDLIATDA